jgi:hypothetical protein
MKTKHLFTFSVLLALAGSSVLLTEMSSIANPNAPVTPRSLNSDSDKQKPLPPANPSSSSPAAIASPSTTPALSGASTSSNPSLPSIIAGVLHLLEIAGIGWAYFRIFKLAEKNREEIGSLKKELRTAEKKQQTQEDNLKKIASNTVDAKKLTARMSAIEQVAQQRSSETIYTTSSIDNQRFSPEPIKVAATTPSQYPFLDVYRRNPDNFKNQYAPEIVSEDPENLNKRRAGDNQEMILSKDRQGNYWLFNDGSTTYLIPSPKLKVNDLNMGTAGGLFTCENYTSGYQSMTVVRPAIVSSQPGVTGRWKLEQKGILEFI